MDGSHWGRGRSVCRRVARALERPRSFERRGDRWALGPAYHLPRDVAGRGRNPALRSHWLRVALAASRISLCDPRCDALTLMATGEPEELQPKPDQRVRLFGSGCTPDAAAPRRGQIDVAIVIELCDRGARRAVRGSLRARRIPTGSPPVSTGRFSVPIAETTALWPIALCRRSRLPRRRHRDPFAPGGVAGARRVVATALRVEEQSNSGSVVLSSSRQPR